MKLKNFNLYICYYIIFTQMFLSVDILKLFLFIIVLIQSYIVFFKNMSFNLEKKLWGSYCLLFIYFIFKGIREGGIPNILYNFFLFFLINEIILHKFSNSEKYRVKKFYFFILHLNSIFLLIQVILKKVYSINILFFWQANDLGRPMGFFSEPSHFAVYLFGTIFLFDKISLRKLSYYAGILLLLKSFVGYIILMMFLFKYLLYKLDLKKITLILLGAFLFFILETNLGIFEGKRFENIRQNKDISFVIRVLKGPRVFRIMSLKEKILGIGIENEVKNIEYTIKTNFEKSKGYQLSYNYYSGIFLELINFGVIGFVIINYFYWIKFENKLFFIFFEIIRLGSSLNFRSQSLYFLLIIAYLIKKKRIKST